MYAEGHQIASHSWTHQDLSTLGVDGVREEIVRNEDAFKSVIGVVPTYFRCPYLRCGAASSLLTDFGYRVVDVSIDTKDYENNDASLIAVSKNKFQAELGWGGQGAVVLAHDIHYQTVASLAEYMIMLVKERGLNAVTVGECIGDDRQGWYRS
jgi:peptidoglycan/xylan/chitin deacetylase (PgdA/CDA1 family)